MTAQHPRLLTATLNVSTGLYRGVLYRVEPVPSDNDVTVYTEVSRCKHLHRNRRKALECAETLARLDGAPQV